MKLRIRGDSVRLRLTKMEVAQIGLGKIVKESTRFLNGTSLNYILEPSDAVREIEAHMIEYSLVVKIPAKISLPWSTSDVVALMHEQPIHDDPASKLFILIEKDFACLKTRENETEDETDMFANPNAHKGSCG